MDYLKNNQSNKMDELIARFAELENQHKILIENLEAEQKKRKSVEKQLRKARLNLKEYSGFNNLISKLPVSIYVYDIQKRSFDWINSQSFFRLGYKEEDVIEFNQFFFNNIDPKSLEQFYNQDRQIIDVEKYYSFLYRFRDKKGKYHSMHSEIVAIDIAENFEIVRVLGVAIDMTQRIRSKRHIERILRESLTEMDNMKLEKLSPRKKEVLKMMALNLKTKQIAEKLNISKHTVSRHKQDIKEVLGIKSTNDLLNLGKNLLPPQKDDE